uniref:SCAN box domain-containing protein n=1 Tax=Amphilophus citrinellus TaxID=61819 RepID=A0A3Q0REP2_AMPCI
MVNNKHYLFSTMIYKYPFIHPFSSAYLGPGRGGQEPKQRSPGFPLPAHPEGPQGIPRPAERYNLPSVPGGLPRGPLPDGRTPHLISKGEASHPAKETHFCRLYSRSYSFRSLQIESGETPRELYVRLKDLFTRWVKPEKSTVQEISEQIILDLYDSRRTDLSFACSLSA